MTVLGKVEYVSLPVKPKGRGRGGQKREGQEVKSACVYLVIATFHKTT